MPDHTSTDKSPRNLGEKPPFDERRQKPPGSEHEMRQRPDHGENTYRGSGRLRDKATLITGADSGIGKAVAIAYAREGADVAIGYLPGEEKDAMETVRQVESAGRRALQLPGDIGDERYCIEMVDRTLE